MELAYPWILIIGIIALIVLGIIKLQKENGYKSGKKVANTKYIKNIQYYQKLIKKYKILVFCIKGACTLGILASLILIAKPVKTVSNDTPKYGRDIFLCMDASTSVDELNLELVNNFKEIVKSLNGDRVGITIFNTSSVVLVPLTDDYEYVNEILDTLYKAFEYSYKETTLNINSSWDEESSYLIEYLRSGTLIGNQMRGSSIIGDGLASCLYYFTDLDEDKDRTRIVIFSTDNDLAGEEIVTLKEAGTIAKEKNITVYGIAPSTIKEEDKQEMKLTVEKTGGNYYTQGTRSTVKDIVNNIEKSGKGLMKIKNETSNVVTPEIPFIVLVISVFTLFILDRKVNL